MRKRGGLPLLARLQSKESKVKDTRAKEREDDKKHFKCAAGQNIQHWDAKRAEWNHQTFFFREPAANKF